MTVPFDDVDFGKPKVAPNANTKGSAGANHGFGMNPRKIPIPHTQTQEPTVKATDLPDITPQTGTQR